MADPLTAAYAEPLKDVVLARLFSQLGQVYDSISLDRAVQLGSFSADGAKPTSADRTRIERFIGAACRRGDLDVTFDHQGMVLHFDQDLFGSAQLAQQAPTESLLQPSPAALLRSQLSAVTSCLYQALNSFDVATSPLAEVQKTKEEAFKAMVESMAREREALLERRSILEQRKNQAEELAARREKEESHAKAVRAAQRAEEQARQMAEEKKRMELERQQKLTQEIKNREARLLAEKLAQSSGVKLDAVEGMDPNELVQRSVAAMEKERKDLAEKIRIVGKRMDHMERAMRKEERPLVEQDYHRQQARDAKAFDKAQDAQIAAAREQHAADLQARTKLAPHWALYEAFRADRESSSRAANEVAVRESHAKIESEKAKRRASERSARIEEARRLEEEERERVQREAEEQRLAEGRLSSFALLDESGEADPSSVLLQKTERAAAEAEERAAREAAQREEDERRAAEEAKRAEEAAKRRAERDADQKKLDDQAARQRQREAEIEERQRERSRGAVYSSKYLLRACGLTRCAYLNSVSSTRCRFMASPRCCRACQLWRTTPSQLASPNKTGRATRCASCRHCFCCALIFCRLGASGQERRRCVPFA